MSTSLDPDAVVFKPPPAYSPSPETTFAPPPTSSPAPIPTLDSLLLPFLPPPIIERRLTPLLEEMFTDHRIVLQKGYLKLLKAVDEDDRNLVVIWGDRAAETRIRMRKEVALLKSSSTLGSADPKGLHLPSGAPHPAIRACYTMLDDPSIPPTMIIEEAGKALCNYQRMYQERKLPERLVKSLMTQLLSGLAWIHAKGIISRDISSKRIYINENVDGAEPVLKISEFGRAIRVSEVSDRYLGGAAVYRPPDVHLGVTSYGTEYDMWSAGCIYAEMISGHYLFGDFVGSLIGHMIRVLGFEGTPFELERRTALFALPWDAEYATWPWIAPLGYRRVLGNHWSPASAAFLNSFIQFDPTSRTTAAQALRSPYLRLDPIKIARPPTPDLSTPQVDSQEDQEISEILEQIMTLHQHDPEMARKPDISEQYDQERVIAEETLESLLGL